ncbi:MAG: hypothetical protein Q3971_02710 [Moraxella sp.]|nr:hypothetical protein [Moraxella sp.]
MKTPFIALALITGLAHAQEIYVIHTYGDPAIVQIAQDELNRGRGGTASMYQDKLIIKAHPADYARVSALVRQVDTAPAPLTVSVAVAHQLYEHTHGGQVNVGISHRVWVNGRYQNDTRTSQTNSVYTARTLSGSPVSIGSNTLIGLTSWQSHRQGGRYWVNFGTTWMALSDGFSATAKALPNGQISLNLHQSTTHQHTLNTTLTLPKGQWVKVGEIAKDAQGTRSGFGFGQSSTREQVPIWVRVD